jgi:predicted nucleotidyltransferase
MSLPIAKLDAATVRATGLFVRRIAEHYDLRAAILFGSRARQTHRPDSDADVAVLLRGATQRCLPVMLEMSDIAFDVLLETGIDIQPLPIWDEQWRDPASHSNPQLLKNIACEGILLEADDDDTVCLF